MFAILSPRFSERAGHVAAAALAWLSAAVAPAWRFLAPSLPPAWEVPLPALVLVAGYRLSGRFFISPAEHLERRLRLIDDASLAGALAWFREAPRP